MAQGPLIDQEFLEKLERLTLHWQQSFRGAIGGRVPSRISGPGQEFLDHRHFRQGDDLRAVNWRAYMRLEKLFLKLFQVEPRIPVRLLIDTSASMTSKFHYARRLAAALCYVGMVRLDTITIRGFSHRLMDPVTCAGGRHRFLPAVSYLESLNSADRGDYLAVAKEFVSAHPQRGLLILISDFLDGTGIAKPIQLLSNFGHELLNIHVWSPEDREPPYEGELELIDAETGDTLELAFDAEARRSYTAAFDQHCQEVQTLTHRCGGRYAGLSTETPLEEALFGAIMTAGGVQ